MESRRREDTKLTRIDADIERIATLIVDAAFAVHQYFGPGMLESIYEKAFFHALRKRGLHPVTQVPIPVYYEDELMDHGFRADMIVNDKIIIEIKSCEAILPVHRAQTLSYTRLANMPLGFLINFNVPLIKHGIVRVINERFAPSRLCDNLKRKV